MKRFIRVYGSGSGSVRHPGQNHHTHPQSRGGTPIPHRSYKFEECNTRDTAANDGICDKEKSNSLRQERVVDRATKN